MKKLFRNDEEIAEELVRLAVNKRLWLSRCLLLFPFVVKGKTFRTTLAFRLMCWVAAALLVGCCIWSSIIFNSMGEPFGFLFLLPMAASYLTLFINQVWMHTKKAVLDDFLLNLRKCRPYLKVDGIKDTIGSCLPIFFCFMLYIGFWIITSNGHKLDTIAIIVLYSQLGLFLSIAMVEQFCFLLSLVRQQLSRTNLLSDMDQDALIAAAANLNEIFSPHLLVTIMVIFVSELGKIYTTIILHEERLNIHDCIVLLLQSFPIWRVVSSCQQFVKQVDKSYDRTYSHLLNQRHRIEPVLEIHLPRHIIYVTVFHSSCHADYFRKKQSLIGRMNGTQKINVLKSCSFENALELKKRMELHLSMRTKFVFTAAGMFDLDYQLIRGMITTAATYIVVLLQFTPDKKELKSKLNIS